MEELRIDPTIQYDVVELPSKGIHYDNKIKSVRVAYLTASDENILSSPNLISTNGVVNELLKKKILDRNVDINELVEEDKQAILMFLRNTAFGTDYNMTLTDPKTNKEFKVNIDLSTLKIKDFNLVCDSNGEYPYFMKKSNLNITFKFLNKKQEDEIQKMSESWNGNGVAPVKTKELEFIIKSVNGNKSLMEIHNFIEQMPIKDSQDFRKYMNDNKPGLDMTQTVVTPSGEEIQVEVGLGIEFFRPFYGL